MNCPKAYFRLVPPMRICSPRRKFKVSLGTGVSNGSSVMTLAIGSLIYKTGLALLEPPWSHHITCCSFSHSYGTCQKFGNIVVFKCF